MRFVVSPPERITDEMLQQVYLAGFDHNPWVVRAKREGQTDAGQGVFNISRSVTDSAKLFMPWPIEGHGTVTVSTGTLMERDEPYCLPLELARGKISQLRNQITDWQSLGLVIGQDVFSADREAIKFFRQAVRHPHNSAESAQAAEMALKTVMDATVCLGRCYTGQASIVRSRDTGATKVLFGAELGKATLDAKTAMSFATTFNAARVGLSWRDIESSEGARRWDLADRQIDWCKANGLSVCAGPLLQLDRLNIPDWLYLFEGDYESLFSAMSEFVEAAVSRYRDRADVWVCTSRANTADVLSLGEEDIVRIVAELLDRIMALAPQSEMLISIDQPWGEYAARRQVDVAPLHFADLLLRADLGLSGLMLEINMGYHEGGTLPRDVVDFSRELDLWSTLEVPLYVSLCVPDRNDADPLALRKAKCLTGGGPTVSQKEWIERYVPLILAKQYVKGVFWNQLIDSRPHEFPNGGLFDRQGRPKPALAALSAARAKSPHCFFKRH